MRFRIYAEDNSEIVNFAPSFVGVLNNPKQPDKEKMLKHKKIIVRTKDLYPRILKIDCMNN